MGLSGLCLLLLAADPAPADQQLSVDLIATLQSQVGTDVGNFGSGVGTDLQLEPGVIIREQSHTSSLTLAYIPWLLYTPSQPDDVLVLQRIRVDASGQINPTSGISVSGRLWLGDQSFSPTVNLTGSPAGGQGQGPTGPVFPGQLPQVQVLKVFETTARIGYFVNTSRLLRLEFDAGFGWTEGQHPVDRLQLPLQRGPVFEARAKIALTASDDLIPQLRTSLLIFGPVFRAAGSTDANGETVVVQHFQTGLTLVGGDVGVRWQHRASATLVTELAGGMGVVRQSPSYDLSVESGLRVPIPSEVTFFPILEARLRNRFPVANNVMAVTAALALVPIVDQFSAAVLERLEALASVSYGISARWRLEAFTSASLAINPRQLYVRGEVQAVYRPSPKFAIAAGSRVGYVDYFSPTLLNGFSWVVYLSVAGGTGALP
jgi:hypothetical protein